MKRTCSMTVRGRETGGYFVYCGAGEKDREKQRMGWAWERNLTPK